MAWPTSGTQSSTGSALFRSLDGIVASTIDFNLHAAALIESIFRLNQFWMVSGDPAHPLTASCFLIGRRKKYHIAFEGHVGAFEQQHRHQLHRDHMLHIESATPVDKAVSDIGSERIMGPFIGLNGYHIGMAHQE